MTAAIDAIYLPAEADARPLFVEGAVDASTVAEGQIVEDRSAEPFHAIFRHVAAALQAARHQRILAGRGVVPDSACDFFLVRSGLLAEHEGVVGLAVAV